MSNDSDFTKEEIYRVIKSLSAEEKDKLSKEYLEENKTYLMLSKFFIVVGIISLLAAVITLIVKVIQNNYEMEVAISLFVLGGILICLALFFKSKAGTLGKSADDIVYNFIVNGLKSTAKSDINRLKKLKDKIVVPYSDFKADKALEIRPTQSEYLIFDDTHEKFILKKSFRYSREYSFNEIVDYKTLENGTSAAENAASGALTGAFIGGIIGDSSAGAFGAMMGAQETCRSMKIIINLNSLTEPQITLELVDGKTVKASIDYDNTQRRMIEITSVLQYILDKRA